MKKMIYTLLITCTIVIGYLGIGCSEDIGTVKKYIWVAVGENGTILTSDGNGSNWTTQDSETNYTLHDVAYADNTWVAVGENGTILTSNTDGNSWITQTLAINNNLHAVVYSNNTWVAVGENGVIATSTDGNSWTTQIVKIIENERKIAKNLYDVAYAGNTWVTVGENGTILTSNTDASSWKPQKLKTMPSNENLGNLYNRNSLWDEEGVSGNPDIKDIAYGDGRWVVIGDKWFITSNNGIIWSLAENFTAYTDTSFNALSYGYRPYANPLWVAVGENGTILTSNTDGNSWITQTLAINNPLHNIAYGEGKWVAVGENGTILISINGNFWKQQDSGNDNELHAVACH